LDKVQETLDAQSGSSRVGGILQEPPPSTAAGGFKRLIYVCAQPLEETGKAAWDYDHANIMGGTQDAYGLSQMRLERIPNKDDHTPRTVHAIPSLDEEADPLSNQVLVHPSIPLPVDF